MSLFLEMEKGWVVSFFSLALLLKLLKMRKEAVGLFNFFPVKWDFKKFSGYSSNFSTSVFIMYYLLFKIETSVSWMNSMKGFHSSIFEHFCTAGKMLFGNVLGPHFYFELEQICPSSPTTRLSSLRRKKKHLIMLLLGHLKHWVGVWNEGKKKKKKAQYGVNSLCRVVGGSLPQDQLMQRNHTCTDF